MTQSQFSLSWEAHKKNICNGLSNLQQNGEFVDMTLAADGYMVKVHQIILALASPYIKELISSAQCPHPVIFLNKISYTTLSSILEYIYTGEVLVAIENLNELVQAGKDLHIKGLEDMQLHKALPQQQLMNTKMEEEEEGLEDEICYFEVASTKEDDNMSLSVFPCNNAMSDIAKSVDGSLDGNTYDDMHDDNISHTDENVCENDNITEKVIENIQPRTKQTVSSSKINSVMQYTVSNQGSLQMILNRFVYYLKHTTRSGSRQWRCVDYLTSSRCPAHVVTRDDVVLQRVSAHTHAFHDKRILKKLHAGAIFTAIHEAEAEGHSKKSKASNIEEKQCD